MNLSYATGWNTWISKRFKVWH